MNKFLFLLLGIVSTGYTKEFSEQIIMIEPVSWDELQLLQLDNMKTKEELGLSENCPTELAAFEQLDAMSTSFKEILWSNYFWTEFKNHDGLICVIKHDTFNFFTNSENSGPIKTPKYQILSEPQAKILLNAAESIGFDENGINVLTLHTHYHNQAVQNAPFAKYGGLQRMAQFMNDNPRETRYIPEDDEDRKFVDKNGVVAYKTLNPIDVFESKYTPETLLKFEKKVSEENKLSKQVSIYPFSTFEELLEQSQYDIESLKKKLLNNRQSSFIYPISNGDIAHNNGNGTYTPIYPYSYIGYLQNGDHCGASFAGTDFIISSHVSLTAAHNITCNDNRSTYSVSMPGALKP